MKKLIGELALLVMVVGFAGTVRLDGGPNPPPPPPHKPPAHLDGAPVPPMPPHKPLA
ncbi:MAG TPA: hypothetical protein VGD60_05285 [Candidatus Acidoferrales bacterium]